MEAQPATNPSSFSRDITLVIFESADERALEAFSRACRDFNKLIYDRPAVGFGSIDYEMSRGQTPSGPGQVFKLNDILAGHLKLKLSLEYFSLNWSDLSGFHIKAEVGITRGPNSDKKLAPYAAGMLDFDKSLLAESATEPPTNRLIVQVDDGGEIRPSENNLLAGMEGTNGVTVEQVVRRLNELLAN